MTYDGRWLQASNITCEFRNGGTESSPLLGTYCGVNIPPRIQSFSNQIFLRLRTDSSSELKGFEIDWDSSTTGCGGAFTNAARGSITSPNYPWVRSPYHVQYKDHRMTINFQVAIWRECPMRLEDLIESWIYHKHDYLRFGIGGAVWMCFRFIRGTLFAWGKH